MKTIFRYHLVKALFLLATLGIGIYDIYSGGLSTANAFLLFMTVPQAVNIWFVNGYRKEVVRLNEEVRMSNPQKYLHH